MSKAPRAAVVVVSRGGGQLERCLRSILAARKPEGGLCLLVVDNGSEEEEVTGTCRRHDGVHVLRNERNEGFARAVNAAVEATDAEVAVLVNDDAEVEADSLTALVDGLLSAPAEVVAAAALLTDATGRRVDYLDGVLTFDGHAFQRSRGRELASVTVGPRGELRLFPCGGFCALRRADFLALGAFDPRYFAYLEDVDFGWRAALAGRTTTFVPEARARHQGGLTGQALGTSRRGILIETNAFVTAFKNLGEDALRGLLPAILLALQSRLLSGILEHEPASSVALSDPYDGAPPVPPPPAWPGPHSRRRPVVDAIRHLSGFSPPQGWESRSGERLVLESDLSRMWLVSANRLRVAWPSLLERRRKVQAMRRVADAPLFERFPLHLIPTYPGDETLFSSDTFLGLLPGWPPLVPLALEDVQGRER